MPLAASNDGVNARDQFFAVERFGQIIICAKSKSADFAFCVICSRQDQDRCRNARQTQLAQNLVTCHIRQV